MSYDKDWEVHLTLEEPNDHIAKRLEEETDFDPDPSEREIDDA